MPEGFFGKGDLAPGASDDADAYNKSLPGYTNRVSQDVARRAGRAEEIGKEASDIAKRGEAEIRGEMGHLSAGSDYVKSILGGKGGLQDTQRPPEFKPIPPPEQKTTSPIEMWGSMAMLMAGLGGLMTRGHATAALNGAAAVMNAFQKSDADGFARSMETWKAQNENLKTAEEYRLRTYTAELNAIANIGNLSEREASTRILALARVFGDELTAKQTELRGVDGAARQIEQDASRLDRMRKAADSSWFQAVQVGAYNQEVADLTAKNGGRPPSPQQLYQIASRYKTTPGKGGSDKQKLIEQGMEKFREEHPDAGFDEQAREMGRLTREASGAAEAAEKKKGPDEDKEARSDMGLALRAYKAQFPLMGIPGKEPQGGFVQWYKDVWPTVRPRKPGDQGAVGPGASAPGGGTPPAAAPAAPADRSPGSKDETRLPDHDMFDSHPPAAPTGGAIIGRIVGEGAPKASDKPPADYPDATKDAQGRWVVVRGGKRYQVVE